ncbi:MAG: APC family permease, partial [Mycobacterium leprae]
GLTLAACTFVAAAQMASYMAGDSAWLAVLIAGLLCLLAAAGFSELNGMMPSAAGLRLWFKNGFGDRAGMTIALVYMLVVTSVIGAETYVLAKVLTNLIPLHPLIWVILLLAVATFLNIRGVKIAGAFQDIITYGMMASLVLFSVIAFAKAGWSFHQPFNVGASSPEGGLLPAIATGVFLFVGFEWVTPLAEEVTDQKLIPRGMYLAVGLLSVVYALFSLAMSRWVPANVLATSPIPHIEAGRAVLGTAGVIWLSIITLGASTTTFNAGIITISRFMYAGAREGILPKFFGKFNLKYATPQNAILTLFGIGVLSSAIVYFVQGYKTLIDVGAAMESLIYMSAALCVIALRAKQPEAERPFKMWGGRIAAWATAVVFAGLAVIVFVTDWAAGLYLGLAALLCYLYVMTVVPRLKAKQAAELAAAAARRGGRRRPTTAGGTTTAADD